MTFHPSYLEWEDSSAGPTLICVVVVVIIVVVIVVVVIVVVLCVCCHTMLSHMWVRAEVGRDKRFWDNVY